MFESRSLAKQANSGDVSMPLLPQERRVMEVAAVHNWPFRVLGVAPVPNLPVFHKNWWLVPVMDDHSPIPARALERVQAIYAAGVRPKAFLIAHEAPPSLPAPASAPKVSALEFWSREMARHSATALKVTGMVIAAVTPVLLAVLGVGLLAVVGLAGAVLTDPCLIAVTEENVWIEIDSWMA